MVFGVTYYVELHCDTTFYCVIVLPPKVELVVWTLRNNSIFTWVLIYINNKLRDSK